MYYEQNLFDLLKSIDKLVRYGKIILKEEMKTGKLLDVIYLLFVDMLY